MLRLRKEHCVLLPHPFSCKSNTKMGMNCTRRFDTAYLNFKSSQSKQIYFFSERRSTILYARPFSRLISVSTWRGGEKLGESTIGHQIAISSLAFLDIFFSSTRLLSRLLSGDGESNTRNFDPFSPKQRHFPDEKREKHLVA